MIRLIICAFVMGACFGAILMGLCCANNIDAHKKRWWENE